MDFSIQNFIQVGFFGSDVIFSPFQDILLQKDWELFN